MVLPAQPGVPRLSDGKVLGTADPGRPGRPAPAARRRRRRSRPCSTRRRRDRRAAPATPTRTAPAHGEHARHAARPARPRQRTGSAATGPTDVEQEPARATHEPPRRDPPGPRRAPRGPPGPAARPRRAALRGSAQLRLRIGFVLIAMVLSVFGARLVQLQGVDPNAYAAMAAAEGTVTVDAAGRRAATSWTATASRSPTRSTA